jgi:hypothetical protein
MYTISYLELDELTHIIDRGKHILLNFVAE